MPCARVTTTARVLPLRDRRIAVLGVGLAAPLDAYHDLLDLLLAQPRKGIRCEKSRACQQLTVHGGAGNRQSNTRVVFLGFLQLGLGLTSLAPQCGPNFLDPFLRALFACVATALVHEPFEKIAATPRELACHSRHVCLEVRSHLGMALRGQVDPHNQGRRTCQKFLHQIHLLWHARVNDQAYANERSWEWRWIAPIAAVILSET
mmetsp:Transcript_118689/g.378412  ORF Transcript_118689/g.378412 Transcript_118689/m.378412 type:complete len:205 (+) Transcript_118689:2789-3403(+)